MGLTTFLLAYLLGGITFLPVVLFLAFVSLPSRASVDDASDASNDNLVQPGDDVDVLHKVQKSPKDEAKTWGKHESDVAAGYFAVCREYTPMGINAKPIERSTPVGSTTVAAPSPSVYQTMYRSIFDRKPALGPLSDNRNNGTRPKKAGNVFYVVLRHGHLLLFDDDEQLEVRHVVSLARHHVSIYSGEDRTPEGELYIKRNAICLARKAEGADTWLDGQLSKPFFLFSENASAKEDFYFALLRNQQQGPPADPNSPSPLPLDVKDIISLVQKLHASEDHMHTRWLNALLGRVFLGVYKTKDLENFIRVKITKKISRVKRPSFLSNIAIRAIDTGESAPYITNPRLKDLTVEGECGVEADMRYTGNFRLEVAATARIDLGTRFKAREVNLVLAVVIRKVEGHLLFKIKPPPSNRIWFSFQQMPKIEMTIEPIVSSRQITYTVILRQIENRIKEVIAETLVLPFWDDVPFFGTEHKKWRGGVFDDDTVLAPPETESIIAQTGDVNEVDQLEGNQDLFQDSEISAQEKNPGLAVADKTETAQPTGIFGRRLSGKGKGGLAISASASSTSVEVKGDAYLAPRPVRSSSFANPTAPTVGTDATNADIFKPSSTPSEESLAAAAMATLSAQSQPSPAASLTPPLSFKPYITSKSSNQSSSSSREATDTERDLEPTPQARRRMTASSMGSTEENGLQNSPASSVTGSLRGHAGPIVRGLFSRRDGHVPTPPTPTSPGLGESSKRNTLAAVTNAAASAKRWGLNALQRHNDAVAAKNTLAISDSPLNLDQPMGRGRPLPPPGTPLPMPDKRTKTAPISVTKRKPLPSPSISRLELGEQGTPPPLPARQHLAESSQDDGDNVLVVAAPADSEPTTPAEATHMKELVAGEDLEEGNASDGHGEAQYDSASTPDVPSIFAGTQDDVQPHASTETMPQPLPPQIQDDASDDEFSAWMDNPGETQATLARPDQVQSH